MFDFLWRFGAAYRKKKEFEPGSPLWVRDLEPLLTNRCFLFFSVNQPALFTMVPALTTRLDQWQRKSSPDRVFFRAVNFLIPRTVDDFLFSQFETDAKIDMLIVSTDNKSSKAVLVPDVRLLNLNFQVQANSLRFVEDAHFVTTNSVLTLPLTQVDEMLSLANHHLVMGAHDHVRS